MAAWTVLRHAPKWKNGGVPLPVATTNILPPPTPNDPAARPIGTKKAKKRGREDDTESQTKDEAKVFIERSQELAAQRVLAQQEANRLAKMSIDLETRSRQSQLLLEDLKVLATNLDEFADETAKEIIIAMKKSVQERWINRS